MSVACGLCYHFVLVCLRASSRTPHKLITASTKHRHSHRKTLELVRFFERLPHQDASLKNTASLKNHFIFERIIR